MTNVKYLTLTYTHIFLQEHAYKNIEAQISLKSKNILRTCPGSSFLCPNGKNPFGFHNLHNGFQFGTSTKHCFKNNWKNLPNIFKNVP